MRRLHANTDDVAPFLIQRAHNADLRHIRLIDQRTLDLEWVEALARADPPVTEPEILNST